MRTIVLHCDAASQLTDLKRYASTSASSLQVHSRFGRDGAGRLTNITHGGTTIAAGQQWDGSATPPASLGSSELLAGYTFAYDQANRLTELRSWADGTQTAYGYDDRSQLVSAATTAIAGMTPPFGLPGGEGYDFDAGGNRQGTGGTSQSATGTHNQLQTDGTYNYFYDGEGNLIRREVISGRAATLYEWDHRNRLVAVKEAPFYKVHPVYQTAYNLYVEYIYDAFDQRVGKRVEDTTDPPGIWGPEWKRYEAYVWADSQEVLRFTDSDGLGTTESFRLASRYLWSDQVDQLLAEEQFAGDTGPSVHATTAHTTPGETFWPLTDHLGSVRGLVDNNGIIRQHVTYDSFGNRLVEQHYDTAGAPVAASHAEAVDTLFGYTERDWDSDTNLQYNRARWYDPSTGRWLSQDPIGFAAGDANLYRYVGNGATMSVDPAGLKITPNSQWHHLLPTEFAWFFAPLGFKINDPEFGWIIDAEYHTPQPGGGNRCLHPRWNEEWRKFIERNPRATPENVRAMLEGMKNDFGFLLKNGKQATLTYDEWESWRATLRKAAEKTKRTGLAQTLNFTRRISKATVIVTVVIRMQNDGVVAAAEAGVKDAIFPLDILGEAACVEVNALAEEHQRGIWLKYNIRNRAVNEMLDINYKGGLRGSIGVGPGNQDRAGH